MRREYKYPIYLWGHGTNNSSFIPRPDDGYLYHYTKANSLISILYEMNIKPSKFNHLNDISENQSNWSNSSIETIIDEFVISEQLEERCSFISFSSNYSRCGLFKSGAEHPRMWAQYGENHYGACVVLRKDDFLDINKEKLSDKFFRCEKVQYGDYPDEIQLDNSLCFDKLIQNNYKQLFYYKDSDWQEEGEYRLFGIDLPKELSIDGALAYVCLGYRFFNERKDGVDYGEKLFDLFVDNKARCYEKLLPQSFSKIFCRDKIYDEDDASYAIYELCHRFQTRGEQALKYLKWAE
jgi:hypothetical protein